MTDQDPDHDPFSEWDDMDFAIYTERIRNSKTWRDVGESVGLSFSWARQRFYAAMAKIPPPDLEELRREENLRYEQREQLLFETMERAIKADNITAAVAALNAMDRVSRSRRALNGLDAPIVVHHEPVDVDEISDQLEAQLNSYLEGVTDAGAGRQTGQPDPGAS